MVSQKTALVLASIWDVHPRDIVGRREPHLDPKPWQGVGEQIVAAAVERRDGDDVVAGLGDGQDRIGHGRHARGQREPADAAFHGRDPLLQHIAGRIHDAGVDIPRHLEVEQIGPVLGVVEGVTGGLIDGRGDRLGRGIRRKAGMDGEGFDFHLGFLLVVVFGMEDRRAR